MSFDELWPDYEAKMRAGGRESASEAAINAFKYNFKVLTSGASTMIPESQLEPVTTLPDLEALDITVDPALLKETVVLKLNGGLGTGMGLDKAKSLLNVTDGNTFLDLIAKQVDWMKKKYSMPDLKFMLMKLGTQGRFNRFQKDMLGELVHGLELHCGAQAIKIPRSRFAPVKKCDDLLALRSDAYKLTEAPPWPVVVGDPSRADHRCQRQSPFSQDFRIELIPERQGVPPIVKLDDLYKFVDGLEKLIPNGVPSLKDCTSLKVEGPMEFAPGVVIRGKVVFKNSFCPFTSEKKVVAARVYQNEVVELS
eukprot:Skav225605  [mRNA]  locus=scaffold3871:46436:55893:+ [translate_table: standard]